MMYFHCEVINALTTIQTPNIFGILRFLYSPNSRTKILLYSEY